MSESRKRLLLDLAKGELVQIAAVAIVWLEKLNEETPEHGT